MKTKNPKSNPKQPPSFTLRLADCKSISQVLGDKKQDFNAVQAGGKQYTIHNIKEMLAVHQLRSRKAEAIAAAKWLEDAVVAPSRNCEIPETKWTELFKDWIWSNSNNKVLLFESKATTADLETLCKFGWLELTTIRSFIPLLNAASKKRKVVSMDVLKNLDDEELLATISQDLMGHVTT